MNTRTLVLMVMLFLLTFAYAQATSAEDEHWEKVRQLDQLEERFKAETGFTGSTNHDLERMKLGSFEGKFADIPFSADADTTTFRQACERILDKILPYSFAKRSQLSLSRITSRTGYISTDYYQQVNGYRVEELGFIVITYDAGRYRFSIGDNTVELPDEDTSRIITPDEAEQIALRIINNEHYKKAECLRLFYSKEGSDSYYLAYQVNVMSDNDPLYEETLYWIDAVSGVVKYCIVAPYIRNKLR